MQSAETAAMRSPRGRSATTASSAGIASTGSSTGSVIIRRVMIEPIVNAAATGLQTTPKMMNRHHGSPRRRTSTITAPAIARPTSTQKRLPSPGT